jgi:hypothetical protein
MTRAHSTLRVTGAQRNMQYVGLLELQEPAHPGLRLHTRVLGLPDRQLDRCALLQWRHQPQAARQPVLHCQLTRGLGPRGVYI